tara:strand:- start:167 stop:400 length:234 start_codon:yes stop_codon:yes gene_type:complete
MAIRQGTTELLGVYLGATEVQNIYQGTVLIYTASVPVPTTWTIDTWSFDSGNGPYKELSPITTWDFTNGLGPNQKIY